MQAIRSLSENAFIEYGFNAHFDFLFGTPSLSAHKKLALNLANITKL